MSQHAEDSTNFATAPDIHTEEYWARKGEVDLYLFRKFSPGARRAELPVVFLVHGSSFSARTSYDLEIPEHGEYSLMNVLATRGYDVWTMDHEGYGKSTRTNGFSDIDDGVDDLAAAMPLVFERAQCKRVSLFGTSSGALRAGRFANQYPEKVAQLILAAHVWTGAGSPTLARRKERLSEWQATNRRAADRAFYAGVFSRDVEGLTVPALAELAADAELRNGGGSVPNGTYVDMCTRLPLVDPEQLRCPVMIFRGDHDGIATDEDVLAFFARIPHGDKQFVMCSGQAHNTSLGLNRHRFWHALDAFLRTPARVDALQTQQE
ncbi:MAG: alpha/beta hydrolase [Pseudomonadota bacterium]